jgi:tellurium resistance protein TerD
MPINLQKGQRQAIDAPKFVIGLGWDTNVNSTGTDFDLDASVFMLGDNKKLVADEFFVFYNNTKSPDGCVQHTGDNLTGDGAGHDEEILVDLSKADGRVSEICVVVTIHEAASRKQSFGQVRNSFIRVVDQSNNTEMFKYELEEDFSVETAVEFGRIYKKDGAWKFEAVGMGMKGGLEDYLQRYG